MSFNTCPYVYTIIIIILITFTCDCLRREKLVWDDQLNRLEMCPRINLYETLKFSWSYPFYSVVNKKIVNKDLVELSTTCALCKRIWIQRQHFDLRFPLVFGRTRLGAASVSRGNERWLGRLYYKVRVDRGRSLPLCF